MTLNAPTEVGAVAQQCVVTQGGCELCKFAKVLGVELELVHMAGEELEIADVRFGYFKMECFLPLLLQVILSFVVGLL